MKKILDSFIVLLIMALQISCSITPTEPTAKAEDLNSKGLVAGRVLRIVRESLNTAYIDGKKHEEIFNGFFVIALEPGEHELTRVGYVKGGSTTAYGVTYPIDRKFKIEKGKVTNIGLVMIIPKERGSKQFVAVQIDNSDEIKSYIKNQLPGISAKLTDADYRLEQGKYLTPEQVPMVREQILAGMKPKTTNRNYVKHALGTLAWVDKDTNNEIRNFQLIETNTFDYITACSSTSSKLACIIPSANGNKLLVSERNGGSSFQTLPAGFGNGYIHLTRGGEIILSDSFFNIYASQDEGKSWSLYADAVLKSEIDKDFGVNFSQGEKGTYIFSLDSDSTVLLKLSGKNIYEKITVPNQGSHIGKFTETPLGLYAGPEMSYLSKGKLYFKPLGANDWKEITLPGRECKDLMPSDGGNTLYTWCTGDRVVSNDGGLTWSQ